MAKIIDISDVYKISALSGIASSDALNAELNAIFFHASLVQSFASDEARAAFRERWLGNYLIYNRSECFLAFGQANGLVGYLVGALDDPARHERFAWLGYFRDLAALTPSYPAHLHVNVAAQHRSSGIGSRLIEAFAAHARRAGVPGMHVVTGKGMRNVGFYQRNGFAELAEVPWNGGTVVMLGRRF